VAGDQLIKRLKRSGHHLTYCVVATVTTAVLLAGKVRGGAAARESESSRRPQTGPGLFHFGPRQSSGVRPTR